MELIIIPTVRPSSYFPSQYKRRHVLYSVNCSTLLFNTPKGCAGKRWERSKSFISISRVSLSFTVHLILHLISMFCFVFFVSEVGWKCVFLYALCLKHLVMAQTASLSYLLLIFLEQHTKTRPSALISHLKGNIVSTLGIMLLIIFQECLSRLKGIAPQRFSGSNCFHFGENMTSWSLLQVWVSLSSSLHRLAPAMSQCGY